MLHFKSAELLEDTRQTSVKIQHKRGFGSSQRVPRWVRDKPCRSRIHEEFYWEKVVREQRETEGECRAASWEEGGGERQPEWVTQREGDRETWLKDPLSLQRNSRKRAGVVGAYLLKGLLVPAYRPRSDLTVWTLGWPVSCLRAPSQVTGDTPA